MTFLDGQKVGLGYWLAKPCAHFWHKVQFSNFMNRKTVVIILSHKKIVHKIYEVSRTILVLYILTYSLKSVINENYKLSKLDGVGPVDNRPSTD